MEELKPRHLDGLLAFTVVTEEHDPEEACPIDVTIDNEGITLRWVGERKPRWQGTWTELRDLIDSHAAAEANFKLAEEQLAVAREVREEAERELHRARGEGVVLPIPTEPAKGRRG
jgi:hypothetical protein